MTSSNLCYQLVSQMDARNTTVNQLAQIIADRDAQTKRLNSLFSTGASFLQSQLQQQLAFGDQQIKQMTDMLQQGTSSLQSMVQQLQTRDDQIKQLSDAQAELAQQYQSLFQSLENNQAFGGDINSKITEMLSNITPLSSGNTAASTATTNNPLANIFSSMQ